MKNVLFTFILSFILCSCVGTVEDKNPQASKNLSSGSVDIAFSGVTEVIPISDNKVEVYFYPATGNSADMTYRIYVNNSSTPEEVKADSLFINNYGQYVYTITGLRVNTEYSFSVGVKNAKDGSESTLNKSLTTKTFSNYTADFNGITKVSPASGDLGKEEVIVEWIPAVSLGSPFSPKPNDPVAYEVRYISAEDGSPTDLRNINNPAVVSATLPASLGSNPQLSTERKRTISGLSPDQKYYFMVRAIHKAYVDYYETEASYKTEQNNKILSVTTLSDSGLFDWDNSSVVYETPLGELALTRMDLNWKSASGPFSNYRAYVIKVGEPTDSLATVEANPETLNTAKIDNMNASNDYVVVAPGSNSYRLSGLESYAYYRATIVACVTDACTQGSRLIGDEVFFRVIPDIAPFSGVLEIEDPTDINALDEIEINFDSPVISAGYINKLEIYCYENIDDPSPEELVYNVTHSSTKANCDGLFRVTNSPGTSSGFGTYTTVKIRGNFFSGSEVLSDKTYCFGAVPVIEGTNYVKRDVANAIVRCQVLQIKVPTKEEFTGAIDTCSAGSDSLSVAWQPPTSGLYDRYEVFWREDDGTAFNYTDAIAGNYNSTDDLTATSYTITNLLPGKKYQYAVLSYISGAQKKYSEANASVRACQVPLPVPRFVEWVDIFSVGPKADGLVPRRDNPSLIDEKVYLFETLNQYGQPLEVDVTDYFGDDYSPSTAFDNQFASISSSLTHQGTYGKKGADESNTFMNQYSNSGIVRLAWKDITFNSGISTMNDFVTSFETAPLKQNRLYGYKVYRSDDNQKTWVDLTSSNYAFQTTFNSGPLHPISYSEYERPNETAKTFDAVMFTDYSVKHAGVNGNVARARVYHYKIVPVFNGEELRFEREQTNPQHIIKVILPPENMALVHRLVANRQTCLELGKSIDDDISNHYTCSWDGVGARGLSVPWVPGTTVYDFGSDMLIDRYELGCNFTRGDYSNQNSKFAASNSDFLGISDSGSTFKGCLFKNASLAQNENGNEPSSGTYTDYYDYRVGDCIGESEERISTATTTCSDNTTTSLQYLYLPGVDNTSNLNLCENADNLHVNYSDTYNSPLTKYSDQVAQSEYGAVFYNRKHRTTNWSNPASSLRAGGGNEASPDRLQFERNQYPSRCMINIPVANNDSGARGGGRLKQRWIPANMLNDLVYDGDTVNKVSLADKTMTEVEALSEMFDGSRNAVPASGYRSNSAARRFDPDASPIARIVSSNDSKLPPLNGLDHDSADIFCSTYEVEVGILDDSSSTFLTQETAASKRMMRRTEGIVAGAHPKAFDDTTITSLESGLRSESPTGSGGSIFNGSCNSYDRSITQGQLISTVEAGLPISVRSPDSQVIISTDQNGAGLLTGSSFFDYEGNSFSTQSCISRYGLQDVIGNMEEYSSERSFCNYSGESFLIGTSSQAVGSVAYNSGQSYNDSNLEPWVQSDPDTGRCSTVETGSARASSFSSGSFFIPVFDFLGNLNTSMVTATNDVDQNSIGYLRNGDGYFLDFGQDNLAPPISIHDTLALVDEYPVTSRRPSGANDPRRGKYFSPISGIPLECGDTSCANATDNTSISTTSLRTKFSLADTAFTVPDYPIGNSLITSDGMSEITKNKETTISASNSYVYSITYLDTINPSNFVTSSSNDSLDIDIYRSWWVVDRNSYIYSRNFGGKSRTSRPGRYSARFLGKSSVNQRASSDNGVRCAIRINEGRP
ncbi:fibronectin type III domain-containing protein [Halobacteriovorax sp.]|uniref:fibronectin type III domain-containing protein n=1 Tax=Halobacteriovorax sp. TaxID=2020862 RepID=UPI00356559EB